MDKALASISSVIVRSAPAVGRNSEAYCAATASKWRITRPIGR
jgi:hypothetical protein